LNPFIFNLFLKIINFDYYILFFYINFKFLETGDWGLGIGDWGLGIGDWAQSPIPNPQSPIPNPHVNLYFKKI